MPSATFYLALSESTKWPYLSARITQRKPRLEASEILLSLAVDVPSSLFERPALHATVHVPENTQAPTITTEVQDGIAAVLHQQLGLRVVVSAEPEA